MKFESIAELRYLRFRSYNRVVGLVQGKTRRRRMDAFMRLVKPKAGECILDLGGQPEIWDLVEQPLDVTILNLPGATRTATGSRHRLRFVQGDACELRDFADRSFDLVFSNSVIEHVGDESRQLAFAGHVMRLAERYWVQTPAPQFPLEPHTGMPFWWLYPQGVRERLLRRWHRKLPSWTAAIAATRVLSRGELQALFPDARIYTEEFLGIPKSFSAYRA